MIKLELIKYDNANCLEATWKENEIHIHCQAYDCSQMDLLRADAEKYKTDLSEHQELIELMESLVPEPDLEAIAKYELEQKIAEADLYLASTDWVNTYKIRHDLELEIIPEDSSKWEVINKRAEYIEFLKGAK